MELQLAEEMGVSRTPVREAIRKMELEGLVVMIPRRGAYVADISIQDINEVYQIRTALDVLAAGLAAERISDEEVKEMQVLLDADIPLIDALAERNVEKAQRAVRIHMENAERTLLKVIETKEEQSAKDKKEGKA